jgi:hypothetical protein
MQTKSGISSRPQKQKKPTKNPQASMDLGQNQRTRKYLKYVKKTFQTQHLRRASTQSSKRNSPARHQARYSKNLPYIFSEYRSSRQGEISISLITKVTCQGA